MQIPHKAVMLEEVKTYFKTLDKGVFLDCTLGYAGHSYALLKEHENLSLVACDQDQTALEFSQERLKEFEKRTQFFHCNFSEILEQIPTQNLKGILADIGVSSLQLDKNERGFSLKSDFLDMRMNQQAKLSAKEIVNSYSQNELERIFRDYGELNDAKNLSEKICKARAKQEITSAKELVELIGLGTLGSRKILKATLVFQALRIEVNQELKVLEGFLNQLENLALNDCILILICFHSLEDRIVKNYFKKWNKSCICDDFALKCECGNNHSLGKILTKKALIPSEKEKKENPRSNCAKMRVFHFTNNGKIC